MFIISENILCDNKFWTCTVIYYFPCQNGYVFRNYRDTSFKTKTSWRVLCRWYLLPLTESFLWPTSIGLNAYLLGALRKCRNGFSWNFHEMSGMKMSNGYILVCYGSLLESEGRLNKKMSYQYRDTNVKDKIFLNRNHVPGRTLFFIEMGNRNCSYHHGLPCFMFY